MAQIQKNKEIKRPRAVVPCAKERSTSFLVGGRKINNLNNFIKKKLVELNII